MFSSSCKTLSHCRQFRPSIHKQNKTIFTDSIHLIFKILNIKGHSENYSQMRIKGNRHVFLFSILGIITMFVCKNTAKCTKWITIRRNSDGGDAGREVSWQMGGGNRFSENRSDIFKVPVRCARLCFGRVLFCFHTSC